jgi:type II secretory pathway pseudopilin PulG
LWLNEGNIVAPTTQLCGKIAAKTVEEAVRTCSHNGGIMLSRQKRSLSGFTLVELIVIIGIMAVLAAAMIPLFNSSDGQYITAHSRAKTMFFRVQEAVSDALFVALVSDGSTEGGMKPLQNFMVGSRLFVTVDDGGQISGMRWERAGYDTITVDPQVNADIAAIKQSDVDCFSANQDTRYKSYICIIYKKLTANLSESLVAGNYRADFDGRGREIAAWWSQNGTFASDGSSGIDGHYNGDAV